MCFHFSWCICTWDNNTHAHEWVHFIITYFDLFYLSHEHVVFLLRDVSVPLLMRPSLQPLPLLEQQWRDLVAQDLSNVSRGAKKRQKFFFQKKCMSIFFRWHTNNDGKKFWLPLFESLLLLTEPSEVLVANDESRQRSTMNAFSVCVRLV